MLLVVSEMELVVLEEFLMIMIFISAILQDRELAFQTLLGRAFLFVWVFNCLLVMRELVIKQY